MVECWWGVSLTAGHCCTVCDLSIYQDKGGGAGRRHAGSDGKIVDPTRYEISSCLLGGCLLAWKRSKEVLMRQKGIGHGKSMGLREIK